MLVPVVGGILFPEMGEPKLRGGEDQLEKQEDGHDDDSEYAALPVLSRPFLLDEKGHGQQQADEQRQDERPRQ